MTSSKDTSAVCLDKGLELPSVPVVLMKILQLVDDNRASARKLEELILHDPSLSARILKLANSAFYSFRCEVKTISHAIALLGLNLVKSLAIGVSIFESFTKGLRDEVHQITRLWMHSFGVGMMAQEVHGRRTSRTDGEFAFLCGLLHDFGQVIFFKRDPRRYSAIFSAEKTESGLTLCSCEIEQYGVHHATLGSMLAKHWGLPPDLATVARYHHDPLESALPLVAAVSLADDLVRQAAIGFDGDGQVNGAVEKICEQLQVDAQEWEQLCRLAQDKKQDVEAFFLAAS